ncbi:MAG: MBL fold metallo-hydrolase [Chloroflexi bacterium]|nr:MBL fold metallo-hydrolase [Chloroflexota bacterium]
MTRITVGNAEIIGLTDTRQGYAAASIYPDAGAQLERFREHLTAGGQLELTFGCFLVRADGQQVLVDTGLGPESNGQLLAELDAAGVRREQIAIVLFTHLHGDHTGWNLDRATGRPLFPNARYLVPRGDWDHYGSAQQVPASFTRDIAPLQALGCLELIEGEKALGPSLVTLPTPGHTPGHTSLLVTSGGQRAAVIGDVVLSTIDVEEPTWFTSFDSDKPLAVRTRVALLDRLEQEGAVIGASHLPSPGLGRLARREERRVWQGIVAPRGAA